VLQICKNKLQVKAPPEEWVKKLVDALGPMSAEDQKLQLESMSPEKRGAVLAAMTPDTFLSIGKEIIEKEVSPPWRPLTLL